MSLLILSALPLVALLLFGSKCSPSVNLALRILCIPFVVLVALYSLILGLALVIAFITFIKFAQWRLKSTRPRKGRTVYYVEKDS